MTYNFLFKTLTFLFVFGSVSAQNITKLSNDQFGFTEGPVWDGAETIYFTDIPNNKVIAYSLVGNTFSEAFTNSNGGNGLMFNKNNELVVCEGSVGKLTRRQTDGTTLETLAETYENKRFNTINDLCIDKKGGIYFTDPTWQTQIQAENRLYYRDASGTVTALDSFGNNKPNGVIISADGQYLYLNDSWSQTIYRYTINEATGLTSNRINFATLTEPKNLNITGADGMAIDTNGNLYVTAKLTVQVFDANGKSIQTINFPEKTTNCTFGGSNKDILFVTAGKNLYKAENLGVTGVRHPFDLPESQLSINEVSLNDKDYTLYPNPVINNKLNLEITNKAVVDSISIYSVSGKLLKKPDFKKKGNSLLIQLDSGITKGTYFLTISTSKGNLNKKILVQ